MVERKPSAEVAAEAREEGHASDVSHGQCNVDKGGLPEKVETNAGKGSTETVDDGVEDWTIIYEGNRTTPRQEKSGTVADAGLYSRSEYNM